jgi:hypothetical protein
MLVACRNRDRGQLERDYVDFLVELRGFEPLTSAVRLQRFSDLSYSPVARLFTCGGGARDLSGALRRLAFVYPFATLFAVKAKHTAAARAVLLEHVEALRALHSRASEF